MPNRVNPGDRFLKRDGSPGLEILSRDGTRGARRERPLWICRCHCGKVFRVTSNSLTTGTRSCGCDRGKHEVTPGGPSGPRKLDDAAVLEARRLLSTGINCEAIRRSMGLDVSQATLWKAATGQTWKHLPMPQPIEDVKETGPGSKLRDARELAGFSRHQLAEALGITYQRLTDIEKDRKAITLESILDISKAIGCDPHSIDVRLASTRPSKRRP